MTEDMDRELEPTQDLKDVWTEICGALRGEIGEASYQSWIKPMRLIGRNGDGLRVGVPTRFMREWIQAHYQDRLNGLLADQGVAGGLDVVIHQEHGLASRPEAKGANGGAGQPVPAAPAQAAVVVSSTPCVATEALAVLL